MSKSSIEYLHHIHDECTFILSVIKPETTKDELLDNETLKRAVIRSISIIGEATKKIPADIKEEWSQIPWRNIAVMRNKLIHEYFGVNYSIVWDVVKNKIPEMQPLIFEIIKIEENKSEES